MRIPLQVLLPVLIGVVVAVMAALAAHAVSVDVARTLAAAPAAGAEHAAHAARDAVLRWGALAVVLSAAVSVVAARAMARPLARVRRVAEQLTQSSHRPGGESVVAEVQDVVRSMARTATELRERGEREARERAELAALVEAFSEGVVQLDAEGRIVRANRAGRDMLGWPADVVGRRAASLIRNADLRRLMDPGNVGAEPAEVVLDEKRLLVSSSRGPGDDGLVATVVDLTDLRRLEEVRRDFVANASHELKTPLTSIRGYTETLMAGGLPEADQHQFLATIARNAGRLQHIVDDLLDLSRLESGRWHPELQTVHLLQHAEAAWTPFADRAAAAGVSFAAAAADAAADPPGDAALADPRGLEQVLANLFDNALRYTPEGGSVRVTVSPSETAPGTGATGGPWRMVEVSDSGAGIPRDALPRIFERFYRVDPARSRAEGGTGLGLSIVKHMVESMGGAITARSELGKGTTIHFWLPAD